MPREPLRTGVLGFLAADDIAACLALTDQLRAMLWRLHALSPPAGRRPPRGPSPRGVHS